MTLYDTKKAELALRKHTARKLRSLARNIMNGEVELDSATISESSKDQIPTETLTVKTINWKACK